MVSPTGIEPVALGLGILRSIQLSYEDRIEILKLHSCEINLSNRQRRLICWVK